MSVRRHVHHHARIGVSCPHCGSFIRTRSSRSVSPTCRQVNFACSNEECGATYRGYLQLTHIISPPARPNPHVELSVSPPRKQPANDDQPRRHDTPGGPEVPPANDVDAPGAAIG